MADLLRIATETPLPTILVVTGVFLMLLSLVDTLVERITIADSRRALSLKAGIFLTIVGVIMYLLPALIHPPAASVPGRNFIGPPEKETPATNASSGSGEVTSPPVRDKPVYVQLVAVSSRDKAHNLSRDYQQRHITLLGDLDAQIQQTDTQNGKMYRVRFGPLPNADKGDALCRGLRSAGEPQCEVVRQ